MKRTHDTNEHDVNEHERRAMVIKALTSRDECYSAHVEGDDAIVQIDIVKLHALTAAAMHMVIALGTDAVAPQDWHEAIVQRYACSMDPLLATIVLSMLLHNVDNEGRVTVRLAGAVPKCMQAQREIEAMSGAAIGGVQ